MRTAWISLFALLCACAAAPALNGRDGDAPPGHHTGDGFRNPYTDKGGSSRFFRYIKARYFADEPFPDYAGQGHRVPQQPVDLARLRTPPAGDAQVTWIGHATSLIQFRGVNVLTDPIFSERASPFSFIGPIRHTRPALSLDQLPPIDYVVISHNHYDHLDKPTVRGIGGRPMWLVPLRLKQWFLDQGIAGERIVELDWQQSWHDGDTSFTATPAQHFSGRSLWDYADTLWCSWSIRIGDLRVWFGGDTGYNGIQFKRIGKDLGPFHLGLIPIGAFEPRWFMKPVHVNPEEAVQIHRDVGARFSVGVHWGAFQLAAEEIDAPKIRLEQAARAAAVNFTTLAIGETRRIEMD